MTAVASNLETPARLETDRDRTAELVDRFLARLVDLVLTDVALSLLLLFTPRPVAFSAFSALSLAYYVGLETRTGRTLGKQLLGLRVESREVSPGRGWVTARQALRRHLVDGWPLAYVVPLAGGWLGPLAVATAIVGAGLAAVGLHRDHRRGGWPDRLSRTRVVRRP